MYVRYTAVSPDDAGKDEPVGPTIRAHSPELSWAASGHVASAVGRPGQRRAASVRAEPGNCLNSELRKLRRYARPALTRSSSRSNPIGLASSATTTRLVITPSRMMRRQSTAACEPRTTEIGTGGAVAARRLWV